MEVSAERSGESGFKFADATKSAVEVDADTYPGCTADVKVSGQFVVKDADAITGSLTLETSNYTGDSCPMVQSDPCQVVLDIQGARK
jgi:hypothetical protein